MMFQQSAILLLALSPFTVGGDQPTKEPAGPSRLRAEVVDVFEGGKLLLSVGKEDGVRKGMNGTLARSSSNSVSIDVFGPKVTFVEVGAKHSIVQFDWPVKYLDHLPNGVRSLEIGDRVVWRSSQLPLIPQLERSPFLYERGGAIIDGTKPGAEKLFPEK